MQYKKIYIYLIIIAIIFGSLGGLIIDRFLLPFLSSIRGLSFLSGLKSEAPIIINRREEIHYNDGANTIELAKEASKYVYDIYVKKNNTINFTGIGVALTNDGVMSVSKDSIEKAVEIFAVSSSGNIFRAQVKAIDSKSKLAFISIVVSNTSIPSFSSAFDLKSGQKIIAVGSISRFLEREFSAGHVVHPLALGNNEKISVNSDVYKEFLVSTLDGKTSYVGAPIINLDGKLVAQVLDANTMFPAEYLESSLRSLLQNQKIVHSYFGIEYTPYAGYEAEIYAISQPGVLVNKVQFGSASWEAGLKAGDIIIKIDGRDFAGTSLERILNTSDKDKYNFTIVRGTEELNIDVVPEKK